jgi:hypothetical protein
MTQSSFDREIAAARAAGTAFGAACSKAVAETFLPAERAKEIYMALGQDLVDRFCSDRGKAAFRIAFQLGLLNG